MLAIEQGGSQGQGFAFRGTATREEAPERSGRAGFLNGRQLLPLYGDQRADPAGRWLIELEGLVSRVPAFAIWQIAPLEACFHRYCDILQLASRDVRFRRGCMALMANAERIASTLELVRERRHWTAFNRAAFEIRQDCQVLSELIALR